MGLTNLLGLGHTSTFLAQVTIYEVCQVPLLDGTFKVKWRFRDAVEADLNTLPSLGIEIGGKDVRACDKGHGRIGSGSLKEERERHSSDSPQLNWNFQFPAPGTNGGAGRSEENEQDFVLSRRTTVSSTHSANGQSTDQNGQNKDVFRAEPKGMTDLLPLRSHTITVKKHIICPVSLAIFSKNLQPSLFKLSIKQDIGSGKEDKMGEVLLDLAQFVGRKREGRFLLRNCKTNATVRLGVKMEWMGGEREFGVPEFGSGVWADPATGNGLNGISNHNSRANGQTNGNGHLGPHNQWLSSNRSTISVNSRSPISRTSSTLSLNQSINSNSTTSLSSKKRPVWSPNRKGPNSTDRSATEVIDSIFNKGSLFGFLPRETKEGDGASVISRNSQNSNLTKVRWEDNSTKGSIKSGMSSRSSRSLASKFKAASNGMGVGAKSIRSIRREESEEDLKDVRDVNKKLDMLYISPTERNRKISGRSIRSFKVGVHEVGLDTPRANQSGFDVNQTIRRR